jgi:hypothetical protein
MDSKYIGMDVHQATVSVAVMDSRGRVVMDSCRRDLLPQKFRLFLPLTPRTGKMAT